MSERDTGRERESNKAVTWKAVPVTWSSWYPNLYTSPERWPLTPVSWLPCTRLRITKTNKYSDKEQNCVLLSYTVSICLSSALSLMSNHTDTQCKVTHSSPSVYVYDFSWVMRRDCWYRISRTKHLLQAKHNMVALHLVLSAGSRQAK